MNARIGLAVASALVVALGADAALARSNVSRGGARTSVNRNYNRNTNEGIHMTSIAAAWMNVVYGYGGMRSDGEELVFNPSIPAHWHGYSFKIVYRGSILKVSVTQDSSRIELVEGAPVSVIVAGQRREIGRDGLVVQAA